jgi:translation initiation factor IF-3
MIQVIRLFHASGGRTGNRKEAFIKTGVLYIATTSNTGLMINEEIRNKEVRLIDSDDTMLGIVATKDALQLALDKNLDLVMIAPKAEPPVCKIMDYGKYMFEKSKHEKEARKNQKIIQIKEVRLSPTIDEHDFDFKAKNACKFLKEGDKVKVTMRLRGRQFNYTSLADLVFVRFAEAVQEFGVPEKKAKLEGKSMIMVLNPKP